MKKIRCKKCNKLLATVEKTTIAIKGKTHAQISAGEYKFKCILCDTVAEGTVNQI